MSLIHVSTSNPIIAGPDYNSQQTSTVQTAHNSGCVACSSTRLITGTAKPTVRSANNSKQVLQPLDIGQCLAVRILCHRRNGRMRIENNVDASAGIVLILGRGAN